MAGDVNVCVQPNVKVHKQQKVNQQANALFKNVLQNLHMYMQIDRGRTIWNDPDTFE